MDLQKKLASLKATIQQLEMKYSRKPNSVLLLAASKSQSIDTLQAAIHAGQRIFGENFLQEALPKIKALQHDDLEWHFIGSIQSNKTRKIAENFDWVQSVNCPKIAERLNHQRPDSLPRLNICLEVNVSHESSKTGATVDELLSLARFCSNLPNLRLRGLMTIPAPKNTFAEQREAFKKLKLLFDTFNRNGFNLDTLSMGMSNDMEAAIAEGATMIRIGTSLFGPRQQRTQLTT